MRNISILALHVAFLIFARSSWAQTTDIFVAINKMNEPLLSGEVILVQEQTVGSPYLLSNWSLGSVELTNGDVASNVLINYNCLHDQLHMFNPNVGKAIIVDKSSVVAFKLQNRPDEEPIRFIKVNSKGTSTSESIFVQVLAEGKYTLVVYRQMVVSGKEVVNHNGKLSELPRIRPKHKYYLINSKGTIAAIETNKRSVLSALDDNEKIIARNIISSKNIRLRRESGVADLIIAINNLPNNN